MLALAAAITALALSSGPAADERLGSSAEGRPIDVVRLGSPKAPVKILVVGVIHGSEQAGRQVTRRLRAVRPPRGVELWIVDDVNPDGSAAGTRQNANGVDLNRNFPHRWQAQGKPFDTYYSGSGPLSEPESRIASELIERVHPRVTLWYHQALRQVVRSHGDPKLQRLYSQRSGLPLKRYPGAALHGTATGWQNQVFPRDSAFVVELPGGRLSGAGVRRHAGAVQAVAKAVAPPRVVQKPIPFPDKRKQEMREYAQRHYGIDDYRLRNPKVIVQHYTVTDDFPSVFNTFAPDRPDVELGELPGVCSHYVIDKDGTIYQLVPVSIMCRHTVGLNWTSIGIEHVGRSDGQVLGNRRQLAASLRLTRHLQGRFGIRDRNVIGHNESLSSPFHRERVEALRRQTHGDFRRSSMNRYRRALKRLPEAGSLR
jgi:N-acetylmuramoyl-L-alanine amidase